MSTVLQAYRRANPDDQRPDDVLTLLIAEQAPDLLESYPDFAAAYRNVQRMLRPGLMTEAKRSFGSAVDNLQATALGAGAMASDLTGFDTGKQFLLEQARKQAAEASTYQPSVASYEDIETPGDAASYAAYALGQVLPSAAETAAAAAAGGGIGGLIAKRAVKGAAAEAVKQGVARGARAGLIASTIPQSQGEIYNEIADEPGGAGIAAVAGTFAGLLDMLPEGYILGKFLGGGATVSEPVKTGVLAYVRRLGKEAAKLVPAEATTEAAQEFINIAAAKYARGEPAALNDEDVERMANAGIIGGFGGAVFAPLSAIPSPRQAQAPASRPTPPATPAGTPAAPAGEPFGPPSPAEVSASAMLEAEKREAAWRASPAQMQALRNDLGRRQFTFNDNFDAGLGVAPDTDGVISPVDEALYREPAPAPDELRIQGEVQAAVAAAAAASRAVDDQFRADAASMLGTVPRFFDEGLESAPDTTGAITPVDEALYRNPPPAPDPREFGVTEQPLVSVGAPAPSPLELGVAPVPTITSEEPVAPTAAIVAPDVAISGVAEAVDLSQSGLTAQAKLKRMLDDATPATQIQVGPSKPGTRRAASRAMLLLDRSTGMLYQRAIRKVKGAWNVDAVQSAAAARPGRGRGRAFEIDLDAPEAGAPISKLLGVQMADGSDRFEVVGYNVLYDGAEANLNLGDARAYLSSPGFAEARGRRAQREAMVEVRGERVRKSMGAGSVKRKGKTVAMADEARPQPQAAGALTDADLDQRSGERGFGAASDPDADTDADSPADEAEAVAADTRPVTSIGPERATLYSRLADAIDFGAKPAELRKMVKDWLVARGVAADKLDAMVDYMLKQASEVYREIDETIRSSLPSLWRNTPSETAGLFRNVVLAIRDSGGDVALFERNLNSELAALREAHGMQFTDAEGRSIVAVGVNSLQNPQDLDATVKLVHEAAHHFIKQLPDPVQRRFHQAVDQMHWSGQRWLMNPLSLDLRLLANSPRDRLSPVQQAALDKLTPQEINRLRSTAPDTIITEQAAEHLAMLGVDVGLARTVLAQVVRFIKDVMLRMGMAIQRTLKGEAAVSDRLVRAYVENRWLQFINRDFARSNMALGDFRLHIGAPATLRETVPTFPSLGSGDPRVGQLDLQSGQVYPGDFAATDMAQLEAKLMVAARKAELGLTDLTRRVTPDAINLTPGVTANLEVSVQNFRESVYRRIFGAQGISELLPPVQMGKEAYAEFLRDYLLIRGKNTPNDLKGAALMSAASRADTGIDPSITIAGLPKIAESTEDFEGRVRQVEASSAQDQAVRAAAVAIGQDSHRIALRMQSLTEFLEKAKRRADRKLVLADDSVKVAKAEQQLIIFGRVKAELDAEKQQLDRKMERFTPQRLGPGSDYVLPNGTKRRLPVNLNFSVEGEKQFVRDMQAMREWLDDQANYPKPNYVQMQRQFRALNEHYTTDYTYRRTTRVMRKTFARSIVETLRVIGTPITLNLARRIEKFQNWILRYDADSGILGARWSSAYDDFAKALGRKLGDDFDETVWDPLMRLGETTDLADPKARERIANAMTSIYGVEISRSNKRVWDAYNRLLTETKGLEKWRREAFESMGLSVNDPALGDDGRRLLRIGYLSGQRSASKVLGALHLQMSPVWSETGADGDEQGATLLTKPAQFWGTPGLKDLMGLYFTDPVIRDFVEPLIRNNVPLGSIKGVEISPYVAQLAWSDSGGDVLAFVDALHRRMFAEDADVSPSDTFAGVMGGFARFYSEIKRDADARSKARWSTEVTPRQMMDARLGDNWPPEWVSYGKYDSSSNYVFVMQSAINSAIGAGGFSPAGDFAAGIQSAINDVKLVAAEFSEHVRNGLPKSEIRERMGEARYEKALNSDSYLWLLNNYLDHAQQLTKTTGYQIGDMRVAVNALGLMASATLQQPKSSLWQVFEPVLAPLWRYKLSTTAAKASADGMRTLFAAGADSIGLRMLGDIARDSRIAERRARAGVKDPDAYVTWAQKRADDRVRWQPTGEMESGTSKAVRGTTKLLFGARDSMNLGVNDAVDAKGLPVSAPAAVKFRPLGIFSAVSLATNNAFFGQTYNAFLDLGLRGLEFVDRTSNPAETVRMLENGELRLNHSAMGYDRKWLVFSDDAAFEQLREDVVTKMGEPSLESFIAKAYRRREAAQGGQFEVIDNTQLMGVVNVAMSNMSLAANATNAPLALLNSPMLRLFSTFLVWPYLQMLRGWRLFQTAQGQYTPQAVIDGLATLMIAVVPATLASTFLVDFYDEEALDKRSNLRELPATAAIPGAAALYPMAALERLARGGTFGLASEALNGMLNFEDARGGFNANNRVFILSKASEIFNVVGGLYQQEGTATYQSVGRPLLNFIGLNGALQYTQLANNAFGLENQEAAINERINASNWLRATGRALDMDVRLIRGAMSMPTPITPWLQQMELGATTGNTALFEAGWRRAVQAAADEGKEDPVKYVKDAFADRHPLKRVFRTMPSSVEYRQMLGSMNDNGRDAVSRTVMSYNAYLRRLGREPIVGRDDGKKARGAAPVVPLNQARLAAAIATYSDL